MVLDPFSCQDVHDYHILYQSSVQETGKCYMRAASNRTNLKKLTFAC